MAKALTEVTFQVKLMQPTNQTIKDIRDIIFTNLSNSGYIVKEVKIVERRTSYG